MKGAAERAPMGLVPSKKSTRTMSVSGSIATAWMLIVAPSWTVMPEVGLTILTKGEVIKAKPDLVRRFVRATARSWEESKKNPGAAVDAALKVKSDLNRQSTLEQLIVDIELLDSKNSKGHIGWGAQADWDQTLNLLKQYRGLETSQPWTTFHTNDFVAK